MRMLRSVAVSLAMALLGAPLAAGAQETALSTLTVTGQGRISRAPDLATVAVAIVTNDDNAAHALSENNRRYAALVTKVATTGVAASDVVSASIQSYFNPHQPASGPGQLFGFVVTRNVQIRVNAFTQLGAVVDDATAAGAGQINGVEYGFRDRRAIDRAALAAAVADAAAQAQTIASAAHVQIVRILRIGNDAAPVRIGPMAMALARTAETPVPTAITPSDLDIESSIAITYVIR